MNHNIEPPQIHITDALVTRTLILSRLLAGRGLIFPTETISAYEHLNPEHIVDTIARCYLDALAAKADELAQAEDPTAVSIALAEQSGELVRVTTWAIDAAQSGRDPGEIAQEISETAGALRAVEAVQTELADGPEWFRTRVIGGGDE